MKYTKRHSLYEQTSELIFLPRIFVAKVYQLIRLIFAIALVTAMALSHSHAQPISPLNQGSLLVEFVDGKVTLTSHEVTTQAVIGALARQCGLQLISQASLQSKLTLKIDRQPLHLAIQRILRNQSYALRYVSNAALPINSNHPPAGLLWIYPDGSNKYKLVTDGDQLILPRATGLTNDNGKLNLDNLSGLNQLEKDQAMMAIDGALTDINPMIREQAIDALGDMGGHIDSPIADNSNIPRLEAKLRDPDHQVRRAAIDALAKIGSEQAVQALSITLYDRRSALREDTLYALAEIGGSTAVNLLQQAVVDQDKNIRETAIQLLAELSGE